MKHHEQLYFYRTEAMKTLSKIIDYMTSQLPLKIQQRQFEEYDIISFLRGVLQIYLEFWNGTHPFEEYYPNLPGAASFLEECDNMITEIVQLLKHIRTCEFFPNLNNLQSIEQLTKLNTDLIIMFDDHM